MILCYATDTARQRAAKLLPAGSPPIETLTERAIASGNAHVNGGSGGYAFILDDDGDDWLVASLKRVPAKVRQKPAWLIVGLKLHSNRRRHRNGTAKP